MRLSNDGKLPFPWLSDGMWLLIRSRRWGLLKEDPDYLAVAKQINRIELYRQAASRCGVAVPADAMRSSTLMDGSLLDGKGWDGKDPRRYAARFEVFAGCKELDSAPW